MPVTIVLAVGVDSSLPAAQISHWKSAGYILMPVDSIKEAIHHFRTGDFDLVLLGPSISLDHKETLACLIRATGSHTPIVCIADSSSNHAPFADATLKNDPTTLLNGMRELAAKAAGMHAPRSLVYRQAS